MSQDLTVVFNHHDMEAMAEFFAGGGNLPTTLTQDQWTGYMAYACKEGRSLAWKVADLIGLGMDKFGEIYYTLVEHTGYEAGYLGKLEGWCRRGLPVTRKFVLANHPECESVPHSWWEAVAPIKDDSGLGWADIGANRSQIVARRAQVIIDCWAGGMTSDDFRAHVHDYRKKRGEVELKSRGQARQLEPASPTFDSNTVEDALPEGAVNITLSGKTVGIIRKFSAYWKLESDSEAVERIVEQLYAIKKQRLEGSA